jgi:hypothetical protein
MVARPTSLFGDISCQRQHAGVALGEVRTPRSNVPSARLKRSQRSTPHRTLHERTRSQMKERPKQSRLDGAPGPKRQAEELFPFELASDREEAIKWKRSSSGSEPDEYLRVLELGGLFIGLQRGQLASNRENPSRLGLEAVKVTTQCQAVQCVVASDSAPSLISLPSSSVHICCCSTRGFPCAPNISPVLHLSQIDAGQL